MHEQVIGEAPDIDGQAGAVAIVGAALRLPGSDSMQAFWDALLRGEDSITRRTDAVPDYAQQPLGIADNARFVPAYGELGEITAFDHERFGIPPAEALLTDPQQRKLLEVVDEALHVAAVSASAREATALFVGTGLSSYDAMIRRHLTGVPGVDDTAVELGTARDYAAGRIAYRLGLRGPAVGVMAACSTGLVAVHLCSRTLERGEADVAVAGVAAIRFPEWTGYWAVPGGISAPDGVCRPFDARAAGTVPADGVVAVVLKRLPDARAAGDEVLGVILGSAVNNDGRKPGFAGVSADAQTALITAALEAAAVQPRDVCYLESHGTATRLGDVVEWAALQRVFGSNDRPVYVGAVKGNLGHTREAAGLAGLLKAVQAVNAGVLPRIANFQSLAGDLQSGCAAIQPLSERAVLEQPHECRIAGVSAFGLGGTNAHVVIAGTPPDLSAPRVHDRREAIVLLSSPRVGGLQAETDAVERRLQDAPAGLVDSLAARSQTRAHPHAYRRYLTLGGPGEDFASFSAASLYRATRRRPRRPPALAFVFPGVGAEYPGIGAGLTAEPGPFATSLAQTAALSRAAGVDIDSLIRGEAAGARATGATDFRRMLRRAPSGATAVAAHPRVAERHLAIFAVQMALVDALAQAGIEPAAVAGHSLGEWTAATTAGAISRADAVALLARRAELIEQAPPGVTLAVAAAVDRLRPLLTPGAAIAADNGPQSCAVSGGEEAIAGLETRLDDARIVFRRLVSPAAFHNGSLTGAASAFADALADCRLGRPTIPFACALTGELPSDVELDSAYWQAQLVNPVLFRQALAALSDRFTTLVEIGPGTVRAWTAQSEGVQVIRTMRLDFEDVDDASVFRRGLAELWLQGCDPRWPAERRPRTPESALAPALAETVFDPRTTDAPAVTVLQPARTAQEPARTAQEPARTAQEPARSALQPARTAPQPGRDDLPDRLAALWRAVLGIDDVAPEDHFFEIGGDSLLGRHLISMIDKLFGVEVPVDVVFASATLDGMATSIHAWAAQRSENLA